MTITYHNDLIQGSDEWLAARRGILTASEMHLIVTPTLKIASNEKERAHVYELLAQRISGYTEPHYVSSDMLRGHEEEVEARILYGKHYAPVTECGFITNDKWGFKIGYSPDGLVRTEGQIECKSRRQKYQVQTIIECVRDAVCPADYLIQCQTGLLVSEREWIDLLSYCGGLPMAVIRVYPDPKVQEAIVTAAIAFEERLQKARLAYDETVRVFELYPTERKIEQEMFT